MVRSFVFSTQGKLTARDVAPGGMPALLEDPGLFLWVDLEAVAPEETKAVLDGVFHFHPLSIQDCIAESPLPKVEEYVRGERDKFNNYLFIVMHAVDYNRQDGVFRTSELNFFLGRNFLVTYHDVPLRSVSSTADQCFKGTAQPPRAPDRVAHTLLDAIVENYKPALDELALEIGALEEQALQDNSKATLNKILLIKKEVVHLRTIIRPQREVLARFAHGEFKIIRPHLVPYFRDVYDSLNHIGELAQIYADSLTGILQVYLNISSNQTGEVVKLLTLITMMATPMTLVATWYGMNFKNMPEYDWKHGYLMAIILTAVSTAGTWWYFKRKKWL